jgi:hypothetical protein
VTEVQSQFSSIGLLCVTSTKITNPLEYSGDHWTLGTGAPLSTSLTSCCREARPSNTQAALASVSIGAHDFDAAVGGIFADLVRLVFGGVLLVFGRYSAALSRDGCSSLGSSCRMIPDRPINWNFGSRESIHIAEAFKANFCRRPQVEFSALGAENIYMQYGTRLVRSDIGLSHGTFPIAIFLYQRSAMPNLMAIGAILIKFRVR